MPGAASFDVTVNGRAFSVPSSLGSTSINEWLRTHAGVMSTKTACGEGLCGACAVMVSCTDPQTGVSSWKSVNSCLMPVFAANGEEIVTAEHLPGEGGPSVTDRLASFHASQCGFCTPGMAVACHAQLSKLQDQGIEPTAELMHGGLDGNLCRCTGYRPIIDACKSMAVDIEDLGVCTLDPATLAKPLLCKKPTQKQPKAAPGIGPESYLLSEGQVLLVPHSLQELHTELHARASEPALVRVVAGSTGHGVFKDWPHEEGAALVSINKINELKAFALKGDTLSVGTNVTLDSFATELDRLAKAGGTSASAAQQWTAMATHTRRIAGSHVRNNASVGGNLVLTRNMGLPSDMATILLAAEAEVSVMDCSAAQPQHFSYPLADFLDSSRQDAPLAGLSKGASVLTSISVPCPQGESTRYWSHRVAKRYANSASVANAAVKLRISDGKVEAATVAVGMDVERNETGVVPQVWRIFRPASFEAALIGLPAASASSDQLAAALKALPSDLSPLLEGCSRAAYLHSTVEGLLYEALTALLTSTTAQSGQLPKPSVPSGHQSMPEPDSALLPMTAPVEKTNAKLQASGTAPYTDDSPLLKDCLFAAMVISKKARAKIVSIDTTKALAVPGVESFYCAKDIPGNNIGVALSKAMPQFDEPLFAVGEVHYAGQPIGVITASSYSAARRAASLVEVTYADADQPAILTIQQGLEAKSFYPFFPFFPKLGPSTPEFCGGTGVMNKTPGMDVKAAVEAAPMKVKGAKYTVPSQYHMYMETQCAVVTPDEGGSLEVLSSNQSTELVQYTVAGLLGVPLNKVHSRTRRVGGGFGGKFTNNLKVAGAAALVAALTGRQCRLMLDRPTDMAMCGGRMDTEIEYSIGFDKDGKILACDIEVLLKAGAWYDTAFTEGFGFTPHPDSVYSIPAFCVQFGVIRCNVPPRVSVRAPGSPQGQLMIENVIEHVAALTGLHPTVVRERNMLRVDPEGPPPVTGVGRKVEVAQYTMIRIWEELKASCKYAEKVAEVEAFNRENKFRKRGLSLMPTMYQVRTEAKSAIVHIYQDGSVMVAHPGIEMGQGLVTKVMQTAAYTLGQLLPESQRPLSVDYFRGADTSTVMLPGFSMTGGSTTSESACEAVRNACEQLVANLKPLTADLGDNYTWKDVINKAHPVPMSVFPAMIPLTVLATGAGLKPMDETKENNTYHTYGAALAIAEVDGLTGDRQLLSFELLYDCGKCTNPAVDLGQVEGAVMFGVGQLLHEYVGMSTEDGQCTTKGMWNYTVPGVYCLPQKFDVTLLKDSPVHVKGPVSSKVVGEPPHMLSTAALLALQHAASAAAVAMKGSSASEYVPLCAPATPEHIKALVGYTPVSELI